MTHLDESTLYPGLIIHARTHGIWGFLIRRVLRSWGNHDAIIVRRADQSLAIGDAEPPRANLKTITHYNTLIAARKYQVQILQPADTTRLNMELAASWWFSNILTRPYDYMAFPRLLLKAIFGDWIKKAAGWEWAWYCTESLHHAYIRGANADLWHKTNPTPRTTEKRQAEGILLDVTDSHTVHSP